MIPGPIVEERARLLIYCPFVDVGFIRITVSTNAIKFSWEEVNIEVWCNKKSFWILDSWEWIEKDKLDKIWDKFYRNDMNKEWFGVWLFIVKRLVKLYKWKIEVESEVWEWTKFIIKF